MFDLLCPEHGGLSHLFIHEASHAVAAIDRGIRFSHVRVLPREAHTMYLGGFIGGGVELLDPDPVVSVAPNPAAALEFALAGSIAEQLAFKHNLDRSDDGDIAWWAIGAGLDSLTRPAIEAVLGRPFDAVKSDTKVWVVNRYPAIKAVVAEMTGQSPGTQVTISIQNCRSLTEAEVRALVESTARSS